MPIKSTENILGITFWARFDDHWKLFDISTTETDTSNNFPLIESGKIGFDHKFKLSSKFDQRSKWFVQIHAVVLKLLWCSPSHTIAWHAHSSKRGYEERTTQRNNWHLLFGFWSYKLFPRFPPVYARRTNSTPLQTTRTCIFCRWVQVCYSYGLQGVCLGHPKQSSFMDIHGSLPAQELSPASTISSI